MTEFIQSFTSLPNLHPAIVHFPIALLVTAVAIDLIAILRPQRVWIDRMAATLYVLGGIAALVAYLTGDQASDAVIPATAVQVLPKIAIHSHWAGYTLWIFGTLAVVRLGWAWWRRHDTAMRHMAIRIAFWLVGVGGLFVLAKTADLGGRLVFWYQVGSEAQHHQPSSGK